MDKREEEAFADLAEAAEKLFRASCDVPLVAEVLRAGPELAQKHLSFPVLEHEGLLDYLAKVKDLLPEGMADLGARVSNAKEFYLLELPDGLLDARRAGPLRLCTHYFPETDSYLTRIDLLLKEGVGG